MRRFLLFPLVVAALLMATIVPTASATCDGYNVLWLAIDVSLSIDDADLATQCNAYKTALQNFIPTFEWGSIAIGVSAFGEEASVIFPLRKIASQSDLTALTDRILVLKTNRVVAAKGTAVGDAVVQGAGYIGNSKWKDCPNRVIDVSTDGETNMGVDPTKAVKQAKSTFGINTNCLGVTSSSTCTWATNGGGLAFKADTFAAMQATLEKKLKKELVPPPTTVAPTTTTAVPETTTSAPAVLPTSSEPTTTGPAQTTAGTTAPITSGEPETTTAVPAATVIPKPKTPAPPPLFPPRTPSPKKGSPTNSDGDDTHHKTVLIAIVIVVVLLFLCGIGAVVFFLKRHSNNNGPAKTVNEHEGDVSMLAAENAQSSSQV